jgi:H+/Cl- antiporter ClcA
MTPKSARDAIPATLTHPGAAQFWFALVVTGVGTGLSAALLLHLFQAVQQIAWPGHGGLLDSATRAAAWRHVAILLGAGLLTGAGQLILVRLTSANGIEITEAIAFSAGRLPPLRTLGSAILSVVIVGMGVSLGREAAPKQAGAVIANAMSDGVKLSDEQRRLLVACAAGGGLAAAYGVPLGGALFALEVLRGVLSLRLVIPALMTSLIATGVSWLFLPNAPTYLIPAYPSPMTLVVWALVAGPIAGVVSVAYVRLIALADRHRPQGWRRLLAPVLALAALGLISIRFPQVLGNGFDINQLAFAGRIGPLLILALLVLKPAVTVLCLGSGAPGGLFTPSLAMGALLGSALGYAWSLIFPGAPLGAYAMVGATAVLAATTQGPISAVVLMIELTGHSRALIVPVLLAVATATMVSRTIEPRSIYDARLTDEQVRERLKSREPAVVQQLG